MRLEDWLHRVEGLHSAAVELGLERVRPVASRLLGGRSLARRVITVAGTNGKGTTCATLEALGIAHGLRVGCYTSPHILRFNERIRCHGQPVEDGELCEAFDRVDACRAGVPLTWFEFTTLVAFAVFSRAALDLAILEVGLGGRLDAVNVVDPDVAVITAIGLDHQDWLGNDRDSIGREKAGILRASIPAVIGEADPPRSVLDAATILGCAVHRYGTDFGAATEDGLPSRWRWWGADRQGRQGSHPSLHRNHFPLANQAAAVQAFELSGYQIHTPMVRAALSAVVVSGRMQRVGTAPEIYLDVAHNPHAAAWLADLIARDREETGRCWLAVFSALADKDIRGIVDALSTQMLEWHYWPLQTPRAATREQLAAALQGVAAWPHAGYAAALSATLTRARQLATEGKDSVILVFGSFYVVEAALRAAAELGNQDNQDNR